MALQENMQVQGFLVFLDGELWLAISFMGRLSADILYM